MTITGWEADTVHVEKVMPRDPLSIVFHGGGEEMLRIARDGFYVRGEQIPQGKDEARKVYNAFIKWLRFQGMAV